MRLLALRRITVSHVISWKWKKVLCERCCYVLLSSPRKTFRVVWNIKTESKSWISNIVIGFFPRFLADPAKRLIALITLFLWEIPYIQKRRKEQQRINSSLYVPLVLPTVVGVVYCMNVIAGNRIYVSDGQMWLKIAYTFSLYKV